MADKKKPVADSDDTEPSNLGHDIDAEKTGEAATENEHIESGVGADTSIEDALVVEESSADGIENVTSEGPISVAEPEVKPLGDTLESGSSADDESVAGLDDGARAEIDADGPSETAETGADPDPITQGAEAAEEPKMSEATGTPEERLKPSSTPEPLPAAAAETVVVERRGAVVPGFVGGAIAAVGLLFAAPYVIPAKYVPVSPEVRETLDRQEATISTLRDEAAGLREEITGLRSRLSEAATVSAVSELQGTVSDFRTGTEAALTTLTTTTSEMDGRIADLSEAIAADKTENAAGLEEVRSGLSTISDKVVELEKRPIAEATDPASAAAVEAYGREVAELRAKLLEQMAQTEEQVRSSTAAAEAAVQEAIAASNAAVAEAEAAAKAAEERAATEAAQAALKARQAARAQALVDVQAALEDGSPFAEALAGLDGVEVPEALSSSAADGVETLPKLRAGFTVAAREALAVSRKESSDDSITGRASTWIQNQLGVRSLAPSEGSDPDAVLSRAEAALAEARLADAVAELDGLPDGGRQIMADWAARATARAEALAAADALAASLATN